METVGRVRDSALANHCDRYPLVTVILRTFEGDRHLLQRSFTSVLLQDLPDDLYEVIIAHDGPSSPELETLVEDLTASAPFPVLLLCTPKTYGYYCVPSNMAILNARGAYLAHLDADNEWTPNHLSGLLAAIRTPQPTGFPHFVYARRRYVRDPDCTDERLPEGDSSFVPWEQPALARLLESPQNNFIDSSDFLIGRGLMYCLAGLTGSMWNHECRRFGDYELACRLMGVHARGLAVDQVSQIYHWTGKNLQITRKVKHDIVSMSVDDYEAAIKKGLLRE